MTMVAWEGRGDQGGQEATEAGEAVDIEEEEEDGNLVYPCPDLYVILALGRVLYNIYKSLRGGTECSGKYPLELANWGIRS